jgi:hypothetical protein
VRAEIVNDPWVYWSSVQAHITTVDRILQKQKTEKKKEVRKNKYGVPDFHVVSPISTVPAPRDRPIITGVKTP